MTLDIESNPSFDPANWSQNQETTNDSVLVTDNTFVTGVSVSDRRQNISAAHARWRVRAGGHLHTTALSLGNKLGQISPKWDTSGIF